MAESEYVLKRVKAYIEMKSSEGQQYDVFTLKNLISQWEFDYKLIKEYHPEDLKTEDSYTEIDGKYIEDLDISSDGTSITFVDGKTISFMHGIDKPWVSESVQKKVEELKVKGY